MHNSKFALDFKGSFKSHHVYCLSISSVWKLDQCSHRKPVTQYRTIVGGKRASLVTAHLHKLSTSMCAMSGQDFRVKPETLCKYLHANTCKYFQASINHALQRILLYFTYFKHVFRVETNLSSQQVAKEHIKIFSALYGRQD